MINRDKLSVFCALGMFVGAQAAVVPSKGQLEHLEDGIMAIVHFGLNTYVDKEWGYGDTPPAVFNPTRLDTDQWVDAMAAAGIRRVVMVTKHHDGFNLWPSPLNPDYTVANTPWKDGKGDVVKMIWESCRRKGLRFGVYLSPWDRHQASYGAAAYTDYYHRQFEELFRSYGPISEIWLDGANGGDGWYGGACERRRLSVSPWAYYRIPELLKRLHELYPDAVAFGGKGPNSAVWVGNESGYAPTAVNYVTSRGFWETPECDTPLRKGWFWHESEKYDVKPLSKIVDTWYAAVGGNACFMLGISPDREGRISSQDTETLLSVGAQLEIDFTEDLAQASKMSCSGCLENRYGAENVLLPEGYWHSGTAEKSYIEIDLLDDYDINKIVLREEITLGQRIEAFSVYGKVGGKWKPLCAGTTMGHKWIGRFPEIRVQHIRVVIEKTRGFAAIAGLEAY